MFKKFFLQRRLRREAEIKLRIMDYMTRNPGIFAFGEPFKREIDDLFQYVTGHVTKSNSAIKKVA